MHLVAPYIPIQTQETRTGKRRSILLRHRLKFAMGVLVNLVCSIVLVWLVICLGFEMWAELMR